RRPIFSVIEPVRLSLAPEARHAVPTASVSFPVAVDPEPARRRDAPGPRDPDEVLPSGIPFPVALDPLSACARRIDPRPFGERRRRCLLDSKRVAIFPGREKCLM